MGHDLASWEQGLRAIEEDVRAPDRWAPSHSGGWRGELGHVGLGLGGPQPAPEMGHAGLATQAGACGSPRRGGRCWATLAPAQEGEGKQAG
jgi:hypothetical protein